VAGGLRGGESVIVLGTDDHVFALNHRLLARGINLESARKRDQYLVINADDFLAKFMVNGWPDEQRFKDAVTEVLGRAGRTGRRVRAFGEMVAILWAKGLSGATVRLEFLWNQLREEIPFPLFCAYPKSGFTQDSEESLKEICAAHTKVVRNRD